MKIDITDLKNNKKSSIELNRKLTINKEDITNKEIISLKDLELIGNLNKYGNYEYELDCSLAGTMVITDSVSLNPVDYSFETDILGNLDELFEELGEKVKKNENSIDIFPIIWENILMEIPIRYSLNKSDLNSGDGWKVISDEDVINHNSGLEKLEELI